MHIAFTIRCEWVHCFLCGCCTLLVIQVSHLTFSRLRLLAFFCLDKTEFTFSLPQDTLKACLFRTTHWVSDKIVMCGSV